jgi:hypothetical protein
MEIRASLKETEMDSILRGLAVYFFREFSADLHAKGVEGENATEHVACGVDV